MKSKLLKTVVLASSLVFLNCGDDAVTSAMGDYSNTISSSSAEEVQPGTSSDSQGTAGTEISSSSAVQQNNDAILPGSSASVEAGSSAMQLFRVLVRMLGRRQDPAAQLLRAQNLLQMLLQALVLMTSAWLLACRTPAVTLRHRALLPHRL